MGNPEIPPDPKPKRKPLSWSEAVEVLRGRKPVYVYWSRLSFVEREMAWEKYPNFRDRFPTVAFMAYHFYLEEKTA